MSQSEEVPRLEPDGATGQVKAPEQLGAAAAGTGKGLAPVSTSASASQPASESHSHFSDLETGFFDREAPPVDPTVTIVAVRDDHWAPQDGRLARLATSAGHWRLQAQRHVLVWRQRLRTPSPFRLRVLLAVGATIFAMGLVTWALVRPRRGELSKAMVAPAMAPTPAGMPVRWSTGAAASALSASHAARAPAQPPLRSTVAQAAIVAPATPTVRVIARDARHHKKGRPTKRRVNSVALASESNGRPGEPSVRKPDRAVITRTKPAPHR